MRRWTPTGNLSGAARSWRGSCDNWRRVALLEKAPARDAAEPNVRRFLHHVGGSGRLAAMHRNGKRRAKSRAHRGGRDSLVTGSVRLTASETLAGARPLRRYDRRIRTCKSRWWRASRSLEIARREADVAVRFARPTAPDYVWRKLGEVGFSLYAWRHYVSKYGVPKRSQGLAGYDRVMVTGAPSPRCGFSWACRSRSARGSALR